MSGHSKWANIVHRKTRQDQKRSNIFSKLSRMITVAARAGGGDPEMNPTLRTYVDKAKDAEMPKDNIEKAIKVGTGELEGVNYVETTYEGYGPAGVAIIVKTVSDNSQRTVAEVRNILKGHDGNMGKDGCVAWMFEQKGIIVTPREGQDFDEIFMIAVDAGADDVSEDEDSDTIEIYTDPKAFTQVYNAVREAGIPTERAEVTMIPTNTSAVSDKDAPKVIKLIEELNDHDDVDTVYSNFEVSDEFMAQLEQE